MLSYRLSSKSVYKMLYVEFTLYVILFYLHGGYRHRRVLCVPAYTPMLAGPHQEYSMQVIKIICTFKLFSHSGRIRR